MKKYLVLILMLVISSVSYAKRNSASQAKMMYGERNEFTSDDPCQAPNVVGCGPCFKACMSQHHGDGALKTNISFGANPTRANKPGAQSGQ